MGDFCGEVKVPTFRRRNGEKSNNVTIFFSGAAAGAKKVGESLPFAPQVFFLGLTYLIMDGACLLTYVHFADRLKGYLENRAQVNLQNKVIGGLLVLSGVMLALVRKGE